MAGRVHRFVRYVRAAAASSDDDANRWKRNLPPDVGWLMLAVAEHGYVFSDKMKGEHGTMQPETVRIPIAFLGPGVRAGSYARVVRSVDIAPTRAQLVRRAARATAGRGGDQRGDQRSRPITVSGHREAAPPSPPPLGGLRCYGEQGLPQQLCSS